MKKRTLLVSGVFLLLSFSPLTQAATITFNLDFQFSGDLTLPSGPTPWTTATFTDQGDNSASNTLNSVILTLATGGLTSSNEYVSSWYFNYNKLVPLFFTYQEGPKTISDPAVGNFLANADPDPFDLLFDFSDTIDLFDTGKTAAFLIQGLGISTASFNLLNDPGDYYSAAEIRLKSTLGGTGVAWIADSQSGPGPTPIPEPATMILLGFGLAGLTIFGRIRFFA